MRGFSRDIIIDLLPAYFSGECSSETKRAVEEFFESDPEFARNANVAQPPLPDLAIPAAIKDNEVQVLAHTRRLLQWRSWLLAGAIFFTLSIFTFSFGGGDLSWRLLESPVTALANGLIGLGCWAAYYIVCRKLNAVLR